MVLSGRLAAMTTQAVLALPVAWVTIALLFGAPPVRAPFQVLACVAVGIAGFFGIGEVIVGFLVRRRYYAGMTNAAFPLLLLLTGVFVPLSSLPAWLAMPSRLLAPTWAMEGVRRTEAGGSAWADVVIGLVIAALTIGAGILYQARAEQSMRASPEAYLR
jgi:ABC-2 type transport system permease protein